VATSNPLVQLHQLGQSIWLDDIGKTLKLDAMIDAWQARDRIARPWAW